MAASRSSPGSSSWPDLPSEMLGLVLLRMPCHADRVRLRAVCRPWRRNALLQPLPPPLPWVALPDGTFLGLPDGAVYRVPVPDDVSQRLAAGSMLFLVRRGDTCCLTNPCSAAMTPLLELAFCFPKDKADSSAPEFTKLVASDHLVAALLTRYKRVAVSARRPPKGASSCSSMMWLPPAGSEAVDIELFQGKLYVLTVEEQGQEELHVLDFRPSSMDDELLKSVQCIRSIPKEIDYSRPQRWFDPFSTEYCTDELYLVASGDRLLLVKREINTPRVLPVDEPKIYRTRSFEVFQAEGLSSGGLGRWSKVDTLMGHALFVSEICCKSLPTAAIAGQCGAAAGAQQDSIYFINERTYYIDYFPNDYEYSRTKMLYEDPFLDSGVYNLRDHTMMPLPLETTVVPPDGSWRPSWLFPLET